MRVQDRYAWVDAEVLGTASRYCGETEATLRASLSVLDPEHDEYYTVSPPSASDRVCHMGETDAGFMFLYAFIVHKLKIRLPLTSFPEVCLKTLSRGAEQLHRTPGASSRPSRFSARISGSSQTVGGSRLSAIYWDRRHYDWGPKTYSTAFDRLTPPEKDAEEDQMNIRDLLKKAKAIGADEPRAKDSRKRKDPPAEADPKQVDGDKKKKKSKFYTEEIRNKFIKGEFCLDQCLKDAQVTYLQQISLLQFLQKDVVPAAERAKENYDKALKASARPRRSVPRLNRRKKLSLFNWGRSGRRRRDLEERRKEDMRKQQEIHDAEVAELKRKLEAAMEGERKSVSDTLRYVERALMWLLNK
ncbi:hypothetical protein SESBI_29119 [Sesbania bispinosa]|nr:hypothetical protein SESBI_29119 [Sesbania bispinosa]